MDNNTTPTLRPTEHTDMEIMDAYTRAHAIEDGVLIDVTQQAKEVGFRWPVAVTAAVWNEYIVPDERSRKHGQCERGRLHDVLTIMRFEGQRAHKDVILFDVIFIMKEKDRRRIQLKALCHGGDNLEPVITVSLPQED